jgi:tetratricopeptide (TPR) repeat protein
VVAAYGLCFYLWKTVVPFGLSPLYSLVRGLDPMQPQFVAAVLVVAVITCGLTGLRTRFPWALAAWACYVVTVSPVVGFVQSGAQIAADRYTYVSCMPWAVLVAAGIYRLWDLAERGRLARPARMAIAAAVVAQLGLFGMRTVQQTSVWKDSFSLWDHVLSIEPSNALAYKNRGRERRFRGDLDGALADLNEALRREPEYLRTYWAPAYSPLNAHYDRGKVLEAHGNFEAALADFNFVIRLDPRHGSAHAGRARAFQAQGNLDGALAEYDEALRLFPEDVEAVINRGNLRQARGDLKGAVADFNQALTLEPERFAVYYNRGNARKAMGDLDGALADYNEALRRKPDYASVYNNRGNVRQAKGDLPGAIADYTEVIRLDPQHANAYTNRGNVRRDSGDLEGAFADYGQAVRLAGPRAPNRATLERNLAAIRQQLVARAQLPAAE